MSLCMFKPEGATGLPALLGVSPWTRRKGLVSAQEKTANKQQQKKLSMFAETHSLPGRLELPTLRLTASRSNQLS